jgi:hypothetical protein
MVVSEKSASETMTASGSPRATSMAVTPPIANPNPTNATTATVSTARREIIPNTCWAAVGDVTTVFMTPSRRSWRAEMPA